MKHFDAKTDRHSDLQDYIKLRNKYTFYPRFETAVYPGIADDIRFVHQEIFSKLPSAYPLYLEAAMIFQSEGIRWYGFDSRQTESRFNETLTTLYTVLRKGLEPQSGWDEMDTTALVRLIAFYLSHVFIGREVPGANPYKYDYKPEI